MWLHSMGLVGDANIIVVSGLFKIAEASNFTIVSLGAQLLQNLTTVRCLSCMSRGLTLKRFRVALVQGAIVLGATVVRGLSIEAAACQRVTL